MSEINLMEIGNKLLNFKNKLKTIQEQTHRLEGTVDNIYDQLNKKNLKNKEEGENKIKELESKLDRNEIILQREVAELESNYPWASV